MVDKYIDGILAYRDGIMTAEFRNILSAELKYIEEKLTNRRKEAERWRKKVEASQLRLDLSNEMKAGILKTYGLKLDHVQTGEKLRAILLAEIYSQPEHRPTYEWKN